MAQRLAYSFLLVLVIFTVMTVSPAALAARVSNHAFAFVPSKLIWFILTVYNSINVSDSEKEDRYREIITTKPAYNYKMHLYIYYIS